MPLPLALVVAPVITGEPISSVVLTVIGAILGGLFSGLFGGTDRKINAIANAVNQLGQAQISATRMVMQAVGRTASYFFGAGVWLTTWIRDLWGHLKKFWAYLNQLWRQLFAWLRPFAERVIRALHRIREFYDRYYITTVKPLIQLISRIRQTLFIFRLLGIKQAQALDAYLGKIQGGLVKNFQQVQAFVNFALSAVNVLLDPRRAGRFVISIVMGRRALGVGVRIATGLPIGFFFPTPIAPGKGLPQAHEAGCGSLPGDMNPLPSVLFDQFVAAEHSRSVDNVDLWPGVDLDAIAPLPYFDDRYYFPGDASTAPARIVAALDRFAEASRNG